MTKLIRVLLVSLVFGGTAIAQNVSGDFLMKGQPTITNAEIDAGAAIASSKLAADVVTDGDIGDGLEASGGTINTLSSETGFLEDGGGVALTCGGTNNGRMQVSDTAGLLEWCDGQATAALASVGNLGATIDDTDMTNENFGEFTCTGAEDGCTLNAESQSITELSDVAATTGTGTTVVFNGNPTLLDVIVDDLLTFNESAGDATCAAGDYWIKGNSTSGLLRGCENGSLFSLSAGGSNPLTLDSCEALTISTGTVTLSGAANTWTCHDIDTEGAAGTDDLDSVTCTLGSAHIIRAANDARTVVVKSAGAGMDIVADFSLDNRFDTMHVLCDATDNLVELSRNSGGA